MTIMIAAVNITRDMRHLTVRVSVAVMMVMVMVVAEVIVAQATNPAIGVTKPMAQSD